MELKRIESLQPKKFSKYYLDRFCTILSESNLKNEQKYFIRRRNLKNNINNKSEEKKELYITSQNFDENDNDEENEYNEIYPEYLLIKEREGFLTNSSYDEEKEKMLYEKLKTKENFNKRSYKNINSLKGKIILTPNFIKNFDVNLAKAIEKNKMNKLTDNQAKNLYYISDLNIFNSIDKLNDKKEKLKKNKESKE